MIKKCMLVLLLMVLFPLIAYCQFYFRWNLWMSTYGLITDDANLLPYYFANNFGLIKGGYDMCIMKVYKASLKFGELTPEDNPFLTYLLYYDATGRVKAYYRKDECGSNRNSDRNFVGSYYCLLGYDGASGKVTNETFYSESEEIIRKIDYTYDSTNRLIVIDCYYPDNKIEWKTKFEYGKGYVDRYEYSSDGSLRYKYRDVKDAKGKFTKTSNTVRVSDRVFATSSETVTYNLKGFVDKIESSDYYTKNGKKDIRNSRFRKYDYKYDSFGNWTDRIMVNHNDDYEWIHCEYSRSEDSK